MSIADELAGLGAVVIVVGRDESRGQSTVKAIIERTDNGEVSFERADLSRLADVLDLADRVAHSHTRLDVLVHNAGALSRAYVRTEDGLELTVAVHVVAPFLLTHLLMGQLRAAPDGRVITMSSGGMYSQRLDVTALEPHADDYDGVKAYARAKRAQVELTRLWDLHHGGSGVRFVAMHPGWVATSGLDSGLPGFARLVRPMLRTPEQGADTAVWLATVAARRPRARAGSGSTDAHAASISCHGRTRRPLSRSASGSGAWRMQGCIGRSRRGEASATEPPRPGVGRPGAIIDCDLVLVCVAGMPLRASRRRSRSARVRSNPRCNSWRLRVADVR